MKHEVIPKCRMRFECTVDRKEEKYLKKGEKVNPKLKFVNETSELKIENDE